MNAAKFPQTVTMSTDEGDAEAIKPERDEAWTINYPWGTTRFYGNKQQVRAEMAAYIALHVKFDKPHEVKVNKL